MAVIVPEEFVLAEFLRSNITNPRGAYSTNSETITATSGQTSFTLSPPTGKIIAITQVEVDTGSGFNTVDKWNDYWPDFKNTGIEFFNGQSTGDDVKITYKYGTTAWIDKAMPDPDNLEVTDYPRVHVKAPGGGQGIRFGQVDAPMEDAIRFELVVYTKEIDADTTDQAFDIDSRTYSGAQLAMQIAHKIKEFLDDNEDTMYPKLYNYIRLAQPNKQPWDREHQAYRVSQEFQLNTLNAGQI